MSQMITEAIENAHITSNDSEDTFYTNGFPFSGGGENDSITTTPLPHIALAWKIIGVFRKPQPSSGVPPSTRRGRDPWECPLH